MYQKKSLIIPFTSILILALFLYPNKLSAYYGVSYSPAGNIFYNGFSGYVGVNNGLYGYGLSPSLNSVNLLNPLNSVRLAAQASSSPPSQPVSISLEDLAGKWIGTWSATINTMQVPPQGNITINFIEDFVNGQVTAFIIFEQNR